MTDLEFLGYGVSIYGGYTEVRVGQRANVTVYFYEIYMDEFGYPIEYPVFYTPIRVALISRSGNILDIRECTTDVYGDCTILFDIFPHYLCQILEARGFDHRYSPIIDHRPHRFEVITDSRMRLTDNPSSVNTNQSFTIRGVLEYNADGRGTFMPIPNAPVVMRATYPDGRIENIELVTNQAGEFATSLNSGSRSGRLEIEIRYHGRRS